MASWFLRGLRKGVVTTRYPRAIDAWTATLPTPPTFDASRLTDQLADRLVGACPNGALTREGLSLVLDVATCSACARCIAVSGGAARPSGVFELATAHRERLVKRIPIRSGEL